MTSNADYLMGISDAEFECLMLHDVYLEPVTCRMFCAAGIGPGMRALDIGCVVGEVSRLLAKAVGAVGSVVAVDQEQRAIERTRARWRQAGHAPIEYVLTNNEELSGFEPFDAAVGRYVLFHQADPAVTVR